MSNLLLLNCKYCGVKLSPYAFSFCLNCGKPIENSSQISTKIKTKFKTIIRLKNKNNDIRNLAEIITQNFDDKATIITNKLIQYAERSSSIPSDALNKLVSNIDEGLDNIDDSLDNSIHTILKKIESSTNDPKVANAARLLAIHSPKIALIAVGIALGPGGVALTSCLSPLLGKLSESLSKQLFQEVSSSDGQSQDNMGDYFQFNQIIGSVLGLITQQLIEQRKQQLIEQQKQQQI
jgi:hypothetical protein